MSSVAPSAELHGPISDEHGVTFLLGDQNRRLAAVHLEEELGLGGVAFTRQRSQWTLRIPRPPVDRMEYLFAIEDHNGHRWTITDPANPRRAPGAFGDKSVIEFAGYVRPAWLDAPSTSGTTAPIAVAAPALDAEVTCDLWAPDGLDADQPAPLLVVHDGPEFAVLGGIVAFVAAHVADGALPPTRVALLGPGDRNDWYSANDAYATALCDLLAQSPPTTVRIGVGVSLGALAMLHAHRRHPRTFDGLFLQSGSFFTPDLDAQESGFSGFPAVSGFVADVHHSARDDDGIPTAMTCGIVEENLANNQRLAATLAHLGYDTVLHPVRDGHNYTAWRDALHPHLLGLVRTVVDRAA
ncbi:MAG TPA: alpha/beta hydrolase-fold protein [Jatrophihabitans sp.]